MISPVKPTISYSEKDIEKLINNVKYAFDIVTKKVPQFEVLNKKYLPEGLKPHTRSICWLAEQVILQNTRKNEKELGIIDFHYPKSDIEVWDVKFAFRDLFPEKEIFINVKVTDITKPTRKNDIASVKKLLNFYSINKNPLLLYAVFKIEFENNIIKLKPNPIAKNYIWMDKFVVNPRNEHVQAYYDCGVIKRSEEDFLDLLKKKAKEKKLNF